MALLESLACGTPVVTTTHSAPQEMVDPGVTGELCPPRDPAALAAACLRGFALTRADGIAERCRDTARGYDWDGALAPLCERLYLRSL
jgi:sucrose-phosphate synthase